MAHDWTELFILDGGAPPEAAAEEAEPERRAASSAACARTWQDPGGAGRRDPGDAVRDARRRDVGAPGGGADHGRRRRAHDREVVGKLERRPTSGDSRAARR
jgi:hypothetical protein